MPGLSECYNRGQHGRYPATKQWRRIQSRQRQGDLEIRHARKHTATIDPAEVDDPIDLSLDLFSPMLTSILHLNHLLLLNESFPPDIDIFGKSQTQLQLARAGFAEICYIYNIEPIKDYYTTAETTPTLDDTIEFVTEGDGIYFEIPLNHETRCEP